MSIHEPTVLDEVLTKLLNLSLDLCYEVKQAYFNRVIHRSKPLNLVRIATLIDNLALTAEDMK